LHGSTQLARIRAPRRKPATATARRAIPAQRLEEIIDAFTHLPLDCSARGSAGWKSHFALIAGINNPPEFGGVLMTKTFDAVLERLTEAIRRSVHERLAPFCAAGFRALCARSEPRAKRPARRKAKR
jgi:hypothetical protein